MSHARGSAHGAFPAQTAGGPGAWHSPGPTSPSGWPVARSALPPSPSAGWPGTAPAGLCAGWLGSGAEPPAPEPAVSEYRNKDRRHQSVTLNIFTMH